MRKLTLLIVATLIASVTFAQSAKEATIAFDKSTNYTGVIIEVPGYNVKTAQDALTNRMEQVGKLKGTNSGKFRAYLAQQFAEFGQLKYDIYTQVVEEGDKNYKRTMVHLLVSKGNMNFVNSTSDPEVIESMKVFLEDFLVHIKAYDLTIKISEHEKLVAKYEKEEKSLQDDLAKMKRQMEDKELEISRKQTELQNTKDALEGMRR